MELVALDEALGEALGRAWTARVVPTPAGVH